jgi:hypothetical protein
MKVLFFAVLEKGAASDELLKDLQIKGYNGTLIRTESLKHVLQDQNGGAYVSLSELAETTADTNNSMFFIIDEKRVDDIENDFRKFTANFTKCHGCMFTIPVENFVGSF